MDYRIAITRDAESDIQNLDLEQMALLVVTLDELNRDPDLIGSLFYDGYKDDTIDVKTIKSLIRWGFCVWRIKFPKKDILSKIRVIYWFDASAKIYHVLAVVSRIGGNGFNYEEDHPITVRCINAIRSLQSI